MAIEKTIFAGSALEDNQSEVYQWLTENADDLFDGITNDSESKTITCTVNGATAVVFTFDTYAKVQIYLNGEADSPNNTSTIIRCTKAYKTSVGLAIKFDAENNVAHMNSWLFLFKTNAETTGAIHLRYTGANSSTLMFSIVDFERNASIFKPWSGINHNTFIKEASLTSLTPISLGNGATTVDGLYITTFTELYNPSSTWFDTVIDIGDTKYLYNGIIALKE